MILVVGGTGRLGCEIALLLKEAGHPVRAITREAASPEVVSRLLQAGVECEVGDLRNAESLVAACAGAEVVISTATAIGRRSPADTIAEVDLAGQLALVGAAEEAGVQRLVFVSFAMPPGFPTDFPLWSAKRTVEARLESSDLEFTILHPAPFMESWLAARAGVDVKRGEARIGGGGMNRISFVALADVARAACAAAHHPGARNRTLAVGGPAAVSWLAALRTIGAAAGKRLRVTNAPLSELVAAFERETEPKARSLRALALATTYDWRTDPAQIEGALGLRREEFVSISDYARSLAEAARAS